MKGGTQLRACPAIGQAPEAHRSRFKQANFHCEATVSAIQGTENDLKVGTNAIICIILLTVNSDGLPDSAKSLLLHVATAYTQMGAQLIRSAMHTQRAYHFETASRTSSHSMMVLGNSLPRNRGSSMKTMLQVLPTSSISSHSRQRLGCKTGGEE